MLDVYTRNRSVLTRKTAVDSPEIQRATLKCRSMTPLKVSETLALETRPLRRVVAPSSGGTHTARGWFVPGTPIAGWGGDLTHQASPCGRRPYFFARGKRTISHLSFSPADSSAPPWTSPSWMSHWAPNLPPTESSSVSVKSTLSSPSTPRAAPACKPCRTLSSASGLIAADTGPRSRLNVYLPNSVPSHFQRVPSPAAKRRLNSSSAPASRPLLRTTTPSTVSVLKDWAPSGSSGLSTNHGLNSRLKPGATLASTPSPSGSPSLSLPSPTAGWLPVVTKSGPRAAASRGKWRDICLTSMGPLCGGSGWSLGVPRSGPCPSRRELKAM